jgi:hypothetical protein
MKVPTNRFTSSQKQTASESYFRRYQTPLSGERLSYTCYHSLLVAVVVMLLLVKPVLAQVPSDSEADTAQARAVNALRDTQMSLAEVMLLYRSASADDPQLKKRTAQLEEFAQQLSNMQQLAKIMKAEMLQEFIGRFSGLSVVKELSYRVAIRQGKFLANVPPDLKIKQSAESCSIQRMRRTGPVGPSNSYQVGPNVPIQTGTLVKLTFSIPSKVGESVSTVPYIGLRDDDGMESVVSMVTHLEGDRQTHTLLLQKTAQGFTAVLDGNLTVETGMFQPLKQPCYLCFFLNEAAEVEVVRLEIGQASK